MPDATASGRRTVLSVVLRAARDAWVATNDRFDRPAYAMMFFATLMLLPVEFLNLGQIDEFVVTLFYTPCIVLIASIFFVVAAKKHRFATPWVICWVGTFPFALLVLCLGQTVENYMRLARHYDAYMQSVQSAAHAGAVFQVWDWTPAGGMSFDPEVSLIYDASDSLSRFKPSDRKPPGDDGWWDGCRGVAEHLFDHFHLCSTDDIRFNRRSRNGG